MKLLKIVSLAFLFLACNASSVEPTRFVTYHSTRWDYRFANPTNGYVEGLDSVSGHMVLQKDSTYVKITSDGEVLGYFWATTGADTARGVAVIWPEGFVIRGTVKQVADTFAFDSANASAWVTAGDYVTYGDSLKFFWLAKDSVTDFRLVITYTK